jgi:hypothetical protein
MILEDDEVCDVSEADAHAAGFEAAFNNECESRNPYPMGSNAHLSWNDGYAAYFDVQEDIRKSNATPKKVDATLARLEKMTAQELSTLMNWPLDTWPGNCFGVASRLIDALEWEGATAVYGHYLGPISKSCTLFYGKPLVHHGWVLTSQGCIIDPTRWVFEDVAPYIAKYKPWTAEDAELLQYDEGGEQWARQRLGPPPAFNVKERSYALTGEGVPASLQPFVAGSLARAGQFAMTVREVSLEQVRWLANQPYSDLGDAAGMLYSWIASIGLKGLVPVDFLKRAEREGQFKLAATSN